MFACTKSSVSLHDLHTSTVFIYGLHHSSSWNDQPDYRQVLSWVVTCRPLSLFFPLAYECCVNAGVSVAVFNLRMAAVSVSWSVDPGHPGIFRGRCNPSGLIALEYSSCLFPLLWMGRIYRSKNDAVLAKYGMYKEKYIVDSFLRDTSCWC